MIWLHLHRPAPAALVRCYGSGWLTVEIRCFGCEDCGPVEMGEDVGDLPVWRC